MNTSITSLPKVSSRWATVQGVKLFYREAGPSDGPTVVLLHGFPSSSHMFRDLIAILATGHRVIAPDYPGFGHSEAPLPSRFSYTFDRITDLMEGLLDQLGVERAAFYLQDYGGPVGFRLATRHPSLVRALVLQNANAYAEGLSEAFGPMMPFFAERTPDTEKLARPMLQRETTVFQYTHGAPDPEAISPDARTFDQALLDRPGNDEIQLSLLHDYRTNPPLYPVWQDYLRTQQPPTLIPWGKNDPFFTVAGAQAYLRDLPTAELHLLDAGHFALESHAREVGSLILDFLRRHP